VGSDQGPGLGEGTPVSLPIVLRDEAQAEFDEAFDWYEAQRAGLVIDFLNEVQKVFDRIAVNPLLHQVVFADIRKGVVRRFP
jgi:plasmid stabilization system protein ParE